jgi:hypothetical protein
MLQEPSIKTENYGFGRLFADPGYAGTFYPLFCLSVACEGESRQRIALRIGVISFPLAI